MSDAMPVACTLRFAAQRAATAPKFWRDDDVSVWADFRHPVTRALVDALTVSARVWDPSGALVSPEISPFRESLGVWRLAVPATMAGVWRVEMRCDQPSVAIDVRDFLVEAPEPEEVTGLGPTPVVTVNGRTGSVVILPEEMSNIVVRPARADWVTLFDGALPAWMVVGKVLCAADTGVYWRYTGSGTLIPDMPGCVPMGVLTAQHMGAMSGDATAVLAATMTAAAALGAHTVRVLPCSVTVTSETVIPHAVRVLDLTGATITRTADISIWARYGSLSSTVHFPSGRQAGDSLVSFDNAQVQTYAQGDWVLLRANNLIPTQTAGSRVSVLRRVDVIGTGVVRLDAALNRTMDNSLSIRKAFLAPPIRIVGGTMEADTQDGQKPLIQYLLTLDPEFEGCRVGNSGGPAISLIYCVGGEFINSHVYDLRDDEDNGHFGYGVVLTGACRGFRFTSGTARRLRHAITTVTVPAGSVPVDLAGTLEFRGEPEHCIFGPAVWAYDTTSLAFDTHAEGYGITITPHASGCFGGVNVRSTNTHVIGGMLVGCRREGIRATAAPANSPASIPITMRVHGTVIDMVALAGVGDAESYGIRTVSPGIHIEISDVRIGGAITGILAVDQTRVTCRDVIIDGYSRANAECIVLDGQNSSVDGAVLRNATVGIREGATGSGNSWGRIRTESVTTGEVRVPTYYAGITTLTAFPGPFANDAAAATGGVAVGQAYRRTSDNLVVVRAA